eukprot:GHUV01034076.1.p3 GENE.GHUV01034076.1~~GHUV01034076.1.p3  ORF type:complete len:110 (+),score=32.90 GHUV01034076.1:182-511(+)
MADDAAEGVAAPSGGGQPSKEKDSTGLILPLARVKRIMREGAEDVKNIATEANYVLGRAAELFLQELAVRAHAAMQQDVKRKANMLDYKDVGRRPAVPCQHEHHCFFVF